MSLEVFAQKESVFFISGAGGSHEDVGGCTLQYVLDNGGFESFDPESIMGVNGAPICESEDAYYEDATGILTAETPGDFSGAEVGMVIYVDELTDTGRHEILEADPSGEWIRIDSGLAGGEDVEACDVYVGGSFDNMDSALNRITASDADGTHDCYLFTNYNESGEDVPAIGGGGNIANNTKLFIVGYNTTLLDMMTGGAYYQSAIDAWYLGIDSDCHVTLDFLSGDYFDTNGESGILLYNLYFKDGLNNTIKIDTDSSALVFFNCILSGSTKTVQTISANREIVFVDCYLFGSSSYLVEETGASSNMYFIDCVLDKEEANAGMFYAPYSGSGIVLSGCLILNGDYAFIGLGHFVEWNNTIIGHVDNLVSIHRVNAAFGIRVSINDIFLIPDSASVIDIVTLGGTVITEKNCIWGNSGAYGGDFAITTKSGGQIGRPGFKTIEADPEFDNDYRPRNPQILRGGTDGRSQLGAYKQKYQFPQRGRIVNHGRAGIIK